MVTSRRLTSILVHLLLSSYLISTAHGSPISPLDTPPTPGASVQGAGVVATPPTTPPTTPLVSSSPQQQLQEQQLLAPQPASSAQVGGEGLVGTPPPTTPLVSTPEQQHLDQPLSPTTENTTSGMSTNEKWAIGAAIGGGAALSAVPLISNIKAMAKPKDPQQDGKVDTAPANTEKVAAGTTDKNVNGDATNVNTANKNVNGDATNVNTANKANKANVASENAGTQVGPDAKLAKVSVADGGQAAVEKDYSVSSSDAGPPNGDDRFRHKEFEGDVESIFSRGNNLKGIAIKPELREDYVPRTSEKAAEPGQKAADAAKEPIHPGTNRPSADEVVAQLQRERGIPVDGEKKELFGLPDLREVMESREAAAEAQKAKAKFGLGESFAKFASQTKTLIRAHPGKTGLIATGIAGTAIAAGLTANYLAHKPLTPPGPALPVGSMAAPSA